MPAKRSFKDVKSAWRAQYKKKSFKRKARVAHVKGPILPREEFKFNDIASATYTPGTSGTITLLNGVAIGDDYTDREGRQVKMKSVHVRGYVRANAATPTVGGFLTRLLLVWDNATNGAAPTVGDILVGSTSIVLPQISNANRFTILRDQQFALTSVSNLATAAWAGESTEEIDMYVPLNDITQYRGTDATVTSIQNGALWLLTLADYAGSGAPTFQLATRVRFADN